MNLSIETLPDAVPFKDRITSRFPGHQLCWLLANSFEVSIIKTRFGGVEVCIWTPQGDSWDRTDIVDLPTLFRYVEFIAAQGNLGKRAETISNSFIL